jgi:sugar lactone lactonase YvrE
MMAAGRWVGALVSVLLLAAGCSGERPAPSSPPPSQSASPTPTFSWDPVSIAFAPDGTMYVSGCADHRIYTVDASGQPTVFAGVIDLGGIDNGFAGDGGPAADAVISCPIGLDFLHGNLLVVAHGNNRVRSIDRHGIITTIVGSGPASTNSGDLTGDGGNATKAQLQEPVGLDVDRHGVIYIADRDNNAVRKVDAHGIITTIAGTGLAGFSGDGGPATKATLDNPQDVAVDSRGNVFVSDSNNHRVRMIDTHGVITTVAGSGEVGSTGDGGPATKAEMNDPNGLAFDAQGNLYVADDTTPQIRKIDRHGVITTFAGTGESGHSGDGGPATDATFTYPIGLTFDADGNLYVADEDGWVRVITPDGIIDTFAPAPG